MHPAEIYLTVKRLEIRRLSAGETKTCADGASGRACGCGTLALTTNVSHRPQAPTRSSFKDEGERTRTEVYAVKRQLHPSSFLLPPSSLSSRTHSRTGLRPADYLPTTRSVNEPGTMLGRGRGRSGVGAGGGPNSAVMRKTRCVFASSAIVRAPLCVGTFSTTLNLPGESSWMTVSVASPPFGLKERPVSVAKP